MLSQLIMKFVNELEKSDPQDIFAMPVTDQIAPGYSTMIRHPMDFSTIKSKCEQLEYESLSSVRFDCHLMCSNCLKYNTEDTPFHSLAQKMQKEVDRIFQVKRAIKFLRRDNVEMHKINEMFEIDRFVDSKKKFIFFKFHENSGIILNFKTKRLVRRERSTWFE